MLEKVLTFKRLQFSGCHFRVKSHAEGKRNEREDILNSNIEWMWYWSNVK